MARKRKASRRRPGPAKFGAIRALRIPIKKAKKISSREIEQAIEKKLASTKTDVFGGDDALVIVIEQHGHKDPIG